MSAPASTTAEKASASIRTTLAPILAVDGAGIELVEASDTHVVVRLTGAYSGCPSAEYVARGFVAPTLARALGSGVDIRVLTTR